MSKYVEIQSHSLVSSYGGIGSLIETTLGSVKILPLEDWPFYNFEIAGKDSEHIDSLSVNDQRLIQRLQATFPKLKHLVKIPLNVTSHNGNRVKDPHNLIASKFFPLWMYCPRCGLFMKYEDWYLKFQELGTKRRAKFDKTCPECYKKGRKVHLEQIRFIRISDSGDMEDLPWDEWFEEVGGNDSDQKCSHVLKYMPSSTREDLESVRIKCAICNKTESMKGEFRGADEKGVRTVLRSSSSVYFPAIIRSLIIPVATKIATDESEAEMIHRDEELKYLLESASHEGDDTYIDLKNMGNMFRGVSLISIRYLTMASVLCSYSRVKPISTGSTFKTGVSRHVTKSGRDTQYLPSIESTGEGFLISFQDGLIRAWYKNLKNQDAYAERIILIRKTLESYSPIPIDDEYTICKYVLLHTMSHLIIKQLEYVSGYPATSLFERIYCSQGDESGIMIYTVAGSEGSYGGIVTLVENNELKEIVKSAFKKAKFCVNDPVCYKVDSSTCFACSLLPETSCESFNLLLDRSFVVDNEYGFYKLLK